MRRAEHPTLHRISRPPLVVKKPKPRGRRTQISPLLPSDWPGFSSQLLCGPHSTMLDRKVTFKTERKASVSS